MYEHCNVFKINLFKAELLYRFWGLALSICSIYSILHYSIKTIIFYENFT